MDFNSIEFYRTQSGLRKLCDSRDAHEEHMWVEEGTRWYCRGYMANVLLGIQGILARIDQLDRDEAMAEPDDYDYSVVSTTNGEVCAVQDATAALWLYRNAPGHFRIIREYTGEARAIEWLHAEGEYLVWGPDQ